MTKEERRIYHKQWRLIHKDKIKSYNKKYVRKRQYFPNRNKQKVHQNNIKRYGITTIQYEQMLLKQNNNCAICDKSSFDFKRRLHIDHNHSSGQIRGLLCVNCNHGLSIIERNNSFFDKAKLYLEKYKKVD